MPQASGHAVTASERGWAASTARTTAAQPRTLQGVNTPRAESDEGGVRPLRGNNVR
jgi:hypothetical protein